MQLRNLKIALLLLTGSSAFAAECGVERSFKNGMAVTVEFEKSFDLDQGTVIRNNPDKVQVVSIKGGKVRLEGKPLKALSLAKGEEFYFGGDHSGCSATHVIKDQKSGLWISSGFGMPGGGVLRESNSFMPAMDRKGRKSMANPSLNRTHNDMPQQGLISFWPCGVVPSRAG